MNNSSKPKLTHLCVLRSICAPWIVLLLLLALPAAVQAQFNYTVNNGTITITGYTGPGGAVTIPNVINGYPVAAIGVSAFAGCTNLISITIPNSVSTIGTYAFSYCSSLTGVRMGTNVCSIGDYAFLACTSLTGLTIPNTVASIGQWAFYACTSLASVTIPTSVTSIRDYTFWACSSLTNVMIPNSVTYIGNDAFGACTSLGSVTIPSSVTSIQAQAFMYCASLASVTIPGSVTTIGMAAFSGCTSLTRVTIPMSVTSMGEAAFSGCTSLSAITVDALNSAYSSVGGVLFNKSQTTLIEYPAGKAGAYTIPNSVTSITAEAFAGCTRLGSVTIPTGVSSIGEATFYLCTSLTSVTIPSSVTYIANQAFYNCTSLPSVTIPNSVTNLGDAAFLCCSSLTNVTIPNSVRSIGGSAFESCSSLATVTIGNSLTNIGVFALSDCTNLSAITVSALNPAYSSLDGVLFDKSQTILIQCAEGRTGNYAVPNTVASIGSWAFGGCTSLTNIATGNSVTTISSSAFIHCNNLASVAIGNSVTSIEDAAFYYCTNLSAITVDALNSAFSSVDGVLFNKSQTTLFQYPAGRAGSYTVPNSVTSVGEAAFQQCSSLTRITIPKGVTSIGWFAFRWCIALASVTIPGSVTSIGSSAFESCTNLTGVYFQGNAPSVNSTLFSGDNNATVYYLPGTIGWGPTFGGRPAVLLNPPTILTSPQTQTAEVNSAVALRVEAGGSLPLFCVWYLNVTNLLSSSTNCELELTNLQLSQSGAYTVVISNVLGAITSAPALLNVIAPVERRPVPGVKATGAAGILLNVDCADSLSPAPNWTTLGSVSMSTTSQYCFDLTLPLPPQRFYRAWQTGAPSVIPSLDLHLVPAITLTGSIGRSVRVDAINQVGPIDAWFTLATVTLTNTSQLYFDTSAPGQPQRLYRVVMP